MSMPHTIPAMLNVSPNITVSPFINGFQDLMTSWMSSLISQQDGCMRLVAHHSNIGHQHVEQLEQTVAMIVPRNSSPDRDHVQYLQVQLAYKEHVQEKNSRPHAFTQQ